MEALNNLFPTIGAFLKGWLAGFLPVWAVTVIMSLVSVLAILTFLIVVVMFLTYMERKVLSRIQDRIGPNRVGPLGLLQPIADVMKLLLKEDTTPANVDYWVFLLSPALIVTTALMAYAVIPLGRGMVGADVSIGVLYVVAIGSLTTIAILMAGWGGRNKYALLGGMRAIAQMMSYEIPMVLAMLGPVLLAGSLSLVTIVEKQQGIWFVITQPIGLLIYFIAGVAEANRSPFDIPEAESELIAGYHIEYSGIKFALFFLAEYINMFTVSAIATTLFLGGWRGPILPPYVWFVLKVLLLLFVMIWFRGTFPRLRIDQLMAFAWKFLLPLALVNVLITALIAKLPIASHIVQSLVLLLGNVALAAGTLFILYLVAKRREAARQPAPA